MTSTKSLSSAALASLVYEIFAGAEDIFGPSPIGAALVTVPAFTSPGRLADVMDYLRSDIVPRVIASLTSYDVVLIRRVRIADADEPLGDNILEVTEGVRAVVVGPTAQSLERALLTQGDYEVIIARAVMSAPLTERDAIRIKGIDFDVVGIRDYPSTPNPVASRYFCKRAA